MIDSIERVRRALPDGRVAEVGTLHMEEASTLLGAQLHCVVYGIDPDNWPRAMLERSPASLGIELQSVSYPSREAALKDGWTPDGASVLA